MEKRTADKERVLEEGISISNSKVNKKKCRPEIAERVDTLIVSVYKEGSFKIDEVIKKKYLKKYQIINSENPSSKFTEFYIKGLGTRFTIRRYRGKFSFHYLTIKISSFEKLLRELGKEASIKDFSSSVIEVLNPIFKFKLQKKKVNIKQIDLAVDFIFSKEIFKTEQFKEYSLNLTETLASMRLPYLNGRKDKGLNSGYFLTKSDKKRIRFYNKELKEAGNEYYNSTYRIEFIFDTNYILNRRLSGNKLSKINIEDGFLYLRELILKPISATLNNLENRLSSSESNYYQVTPHDTLVCDESWRNAVDIKLLMNRQKSIFSHHYPANYYKRKKFMDSSFYKFLIKENKFEYIQMIYKALQVKKI